MDLGTIRKRLERNYYTSIDAFASDVKLTFTNAMTYNEVLFFPLLTKQRNTELPLTRQAETEVHMAAGTLLELFEAQLVTLRQTAAAELEQERAAENVCPLCLTGAIRFEPVTYYCQGSACAGRLRRNAIYYGAGADYR